MSTPPVPLLAAEPASDEIFHLAPFFMLGEHSISPTYTPMAIHGSSPLQVPDHGAHPSSPGSEGHQAEGSETSGSPDGDENALPQQRETGPYYAIPCPRNSREAYLLLEAARADSRIISARKKLTLQIIHRNTLVLQYNQMILERAQNDLRHADQFIGHVRLMIRRSGHTPAFEYAMSEGHSHLTKIPSHDAIDVDIT